MNSLHGKPVVVRSRKSQLTIMFGNAAAGVYRFFLFDSNNKNPALFGQGLSTDAVPDTWTLPLSTPPQAVHVEFSVHALAPSETVPVTLVLSDKAGPYWSHTYIISKAEFDRGLADFFFATE